MCLPPPPPHNTKADQNPPESFQSRLALWVKNDYALCLKALSLGMGEKSGSISILYKKKTSVCSIQQCAEDCHQVLAFKKLLKSTNVKWNGRILSCWDLVPEIVTWPFQYLPCPVLSGECHTLNPAVNAGQRLDICEPWHDHANTHKNEWIIF